MNGANKSTGSRSRAITRAISHESTGDLRYKQRVRRPGARWEHPAIFVALLLPLSLAAQVAQDFSEVHIGAYDADAWNGIVFESKAYGQRVPFAIRIGSKTGTFLDGNRIFDAVSLVGPHAPDGSYSLLGWRHRPRAATITLEWSRIDETTVVGRLKAPEDVQLVLEAYGPGSGDFAGTVRRRLSGLSCGRGGMELDYVYVPKEVAHFDSCKGETVLYAHGIGPLEFNCGQSGR